MFNINLIPLFTTKLLNLSILYCHISSSLLSQCNYKKFSILLPLFFSFSTIIYVPVIKKAHKRKNCEQFIFLWSSINLHIFHLNITTKSLSQWVSSSIISSGVQIEVVDLQRICHELELNSYWFSEISLLTIILKIIIILGEIYAIQLHRYYAYPSKINTYVISNLQSQLDSK